MNKLKKLFRRAITYLTGFVLVTSSTSPKDIKNSRKRLGLSQRELAESLGVSIETVFDLEKEKK